MVKTCEFGVFLIRKMSDKKALTRKLAKAGTSLENLRTEGAKSPAPATAEVKDIEDTVVAVGATKSQFFSPVQTRRQRMGLNPPMSSGLVLGKPMKLLETIKKQEASVLSKGSRKKKEAAKAELEMVPEAQKTAENEKESSEPVKQEVLETVNTWQPENWQQMLANIKEMRAEAGAPVDTMGCDKCSDENADEKTQRFQKLVALMLSSQTKDETTFEAMRRLRENTLTPESLVKMEVDKLQQLLHPVSFYKNKAKYLQQTSRILIDKYDSDIPNNIKELVALPGVGPKMAHICMSTAWNEVTGIGVDVHVHRIANRLRWLPKETKAPEETRVSLEAWLPREVWLDVNHLLVGFGQTVCTPVRPHCGDCLNRDICPSADVSAKKKAPKKVEDAPSAVKKAKLQKKKLHL